MHHSKDPSDRQQRNTFDQRVGSAIREISLSPELQAARQAGPFDATADLPGIVASYIERRGPNEEAEAVLSTVANLGHFVAAQEEVNETKLYPNITADDKERMRQLKQEFLIPFNQNLKEIVNVFPNADIDDVALALTKAHKTIFAGPNQSNIAELKDMIKIHLDGMRHELAAESLLIAAGIEYHTHVTPEDDARGIDLYVDINGNRRFSGIDVKAGAAKARSSQERRSDSRAVWTGLKSTDFKGRDGKQRNALSIDYDTASSRAGDFVERIQGVLTSREQVVQQRARSLGRAAAK